jgi:hypothetical protein
MNGSRRNFPINPRTQNTTPINRKNQIQQQILIIGFLIGCFLNMIVSGKTKQSTRNIAHRINENERADIFKPPFLGMICPCKTYYLL